MGENRSFTYCIDIANGDEIEAVVNLDKAKELFRKTHDGEVSVREIWNQNSADGQPFVDWAKERQG